MSDVLGRLLAYDPQKLIGHDLQDHFRRRGYELTIESSESFEIQVEDRLPDLLLLCWSAQTDARLELLASIRESYSRVELPILVYAESSDDEDAVAAISAGASDYVPTSSSNRVLLAKSGHHVILNQKVSRVRSQHQELERKIEELQQDFEAAAVVQRELLPLANVTQVQGEIAWCYQPCQSLGGDFLNVTQLDEQYVGLYVVDAAGHGVAASLLATSVSRVLQPTIGESTVVNRSSKHEGVMTPVDELPPHVRRPDIVIEKLNRRFSQSVDPYRPQSFSLVYVVINTTNGHYHMSSAGHPVPVVFESGGEGRRLPLESTTAIGLEKRNGSSRKDIPLLFGKLSPGETLLLFSEGVVKLSNPDGEAYGQERLVESCRDSLGTSGDLQQELDCVLEQLTVWRADRESEQDLSLLAYRYQGN